MLSLMTAAGWQILRTGSVVPVETDDIPFCKPALVGRELDYVRTAFGQHQVGVDGPFARRCQEWIAAHIGVPDVLLTTSCTAALEMAVLLADVGPGDEVIVPSYTFAACANAIALRGAVPVFVDLAADEPHVDPAQVAAAVTTRTKAIIVVHYGGSVCDLAPLLEIAMRHNLVLIEDAAHAFLARRGGRHAATLGHLGAYSFDYQKNITAGEAGALVINDARLVRRAEILHLKGLNRKAFLRGEADQYTWQDLGSGFAPSDIVAAVLLGQLERAVELTESRRRLWARYHAALEPLEQTGMIRRPRIPSDVEHNGHIYHLLLPDLAARDAFMAGMRARGIGVQLHFVPLHSSIPGRRFGRSQGALANTCALAERLVRLPLWHGLEREQERVIGAVKAVLRDRHAGQAGR